MTIEQEILKDFVVAIDTRESAPYKFKGENIIFKKLDVGDYSVKGFENEISIERKTHGDFLGSITHRHKQFMNRMNVMSGYRIKAVVIEASSEAVFKGWHPHAKVSPQTVVANVVKLVGLGIPVQFMNSRKASEEFTLKVLKQAFLMMRNVK